ncbi:MAG: luciferase family protein [Chloroflexota bacterium]
MQNNNLSTIGISLPLRKGGPTETVGPVPHRQKSERADKSLVDLLVSKLNGLDGVSVAKRGGFIGRNFFGVDAPRWNAHIHHYEDGAHQDGSMHIAMPQSISTEVERTGWGERHPAYPSMLLVYSPRDAEEVETITELVKLSYEIARS